MSSEGLVRKHFEAILKDYEHDCLYRNREIAWNGAWSDIAKSARAFVAEEIENTPIGELTLIQQVEFKAGEQEPCGTCGGTGTVWADKYSGPNAEPWPGLLFGGELQPCPDCNGKENE